MNLFFNLLSLFVFFLCLTMVVVYTLSIRKNTNINILFIILLVIVGVQRLEEVLLSWNLIEEGFSPVRKKQSLANLIVYLYFAFFMKIIRIKTMDKIYFFLAIIPILITVYSFLYPTNILINYYLFTLNISAFNVIITVEVYRYLIKSKVFSEKINAKTRWVIMIYLSQIFLYLTIIFSIWNNISQPNIIIYKFLRVSSLYWIVVLLYIISNPIVFFGETKLLVKNQNNDNKSFLLWKTNTNITVSVNEQKIWEKIHPLLDNYLKRLFEIENNFSKHLRSKLTISSISKQSNIPVSHIKFIFKYFCEYSFNDYSIILRLRCAVELMENGYLELKTIDSLSKKCFFDSRITFYKNFKKHYGYAPSEYLKMSNRKNKKLQTSPMKT